MLLAGGPPSLPDLTPHHHQIPHSWRPIVAWWRSQKTCLSLVEENRLHGRADQRTRGTQWWDHC